MEIRIDLERLDPPAGRIAAVGGVPAEGVESGLVVDFDGWLGLVSSLYVVLGPEQVERRSDGSFVTDDAPLPQARSAH